MKIVFGNNNALKRKSRPEVVHVMIEYDNILVGPLSGLKMELQDNLDAVTLRISGDRW